MNQLIEKYVEALKMGEKSPNTIVKYVGDLNKMFSFLNIQTIDDLKNISVEQFYDFYKEQEKTLKTPQSFNGLVRSLHGYFNWLGMSDSNVFKARFGKSFYKKVKFSPKVILTKEEQQLFINAGANKQERFMFSMMLKTALRRTSVVGIKLSDIKECQILIENKGGNKVYTYLNDELCAMMGDYLSTEHNGSEYLFYGNRGERDENKPMSSQSVNNRVRSAMKRSGISEEKIKAFHAHSIRGTAITWMWIEKGESAAQTIAFHKSPITTRGYITASDEYRKELLLEK